MIEPSSETRTVWLELLDLEDLDLEEVARPDPVGLDEDILRAA